LTAKYGIFIHERQHELGDQPASIKERRVHGEWVLFSVQQDGIVTEEL
jgi:hypothetical protein